MNPDLVVHDAKGERYTVRYEAVNAMLLNEFLKEHREVGTERWLHVLKLSLRPLQPLAQALDVFIVRLVLLLVHFQQRPQDFDAMLFLHHTLSVFKRAEQDGIGLFS